MRALTPLAILALTLATPALAAPYSAKIVRDDWGIAHVSGKTDADAVFGMIYAQAEDDFNRIEVNYLTALGRRAEAEGEALIWQDLRQRLWVDPADLQAQYARSPAWLKKLMDAWAAGLNRYLADHPEVHPRVLARFEPWMALSFSEGSIGGDIESVKLSQLEAFYSHRQIAMTADERGLVPREPTGSNGIAIAPSHTKDGHALLLINPHTSFFFRSELQMTSDEGLNAYGAVTWGQFFVYQGFNSHAGWMHTSGSNDNIDEFAETVTAKAGGFTYRYGKEERAVTAKPITLFFRQPDGTMGARTFVTFATHHGPVVREEGGKWIATALMNRPLAALQQSFLRTKVSDLKGFMKVAALKANSSNNTVFADSKGETALFLPQFMPVRDNRFDYTKPVDGSDPATDWKGLHALSTLPQVVNPKNGWLFNVNDGPWWAAGDDSPRQDAFPRYMDDTGANPRTMHAYRVLRYTPTFDLDGLIAAAYDPWMPEMFRLLATLSGANAKAPDPARAEAMALLEGWNHRWSLDSTATSLAVFWAEALRERGVEAAAAQGITVRQWMISGASDEDRLAALDAAMARLTADFGSWRVPWGEINRFQRNDGAIQQTFDDAKPSLPVPFTSADWGSLASFGAKRYPGTKRYYGTYGNSFVAAVEFGPRVKARAVTAGGESGNPASPHFNDEAQRYADGNLRPVYYWPDELAGHVEGSEEVRGQ